MVLWKRCSVTQWLCDAPGSSGDSRYNPNAPHFKAPTWLFVFASNLKYWPLLSNCSLGLPSVDPRPTGAQQRVTVTWWTGVTVQPPWKFACSSTPQWSCTMERSLNGPLLIMLYGGKESSKFTASVSKSTTTYSFTWHIVSAIFFSFQNLLVVLTNTLNNTPKTGQTHSNLHNKKTPAFLQVMFQYWFSHPLPHSCTQYLSFISLWNSFQVLISHGRINFHFFFFFQTSDLCS